MHTVLIVATVLAVAYLLGAYLNQFANAPLSPSVILPVMVVFSAICLVLGISLLTKSYKVFDRLGFYSLIEMGIKGSEQDMWKKIKFKLDGISLTSFGVILLLFVAARALGAPLLALSAFLIFTVTAFAKLFAWVFISLRFRKKGKRKTKTKDEWKW